MLKPEQYTAIQYLCMPKHGGLTHEEIAEKCGVDRSTLWRWRQDEKFQREMKHEIARHAMDRMGDVVNAMIDSAVNLKSAAAAKLLMTSTGMLVDQIEIDDKRSKVNTTDLTELRAKVEELRQRNISH